MYGVVMPTNTRTYRPGDRVTTGTGRIGGTVTQVINPASYLVVKWDDSTDPGHVHPDDIEPLTNEILSLASAANTAANAARYQIDQCVRPELDTLRDLLAAVDALTTAICDAEA
jgi:hypothetical protein